MTLPDGLYRVCRCSGNPARPGMCAGFAVRKGKVVAVAPVLRRKLAHWMKVAERVCD
jgi:hypothetical protein